MKLTALAIWFFGVAILLTANSWICYVNVRSLVGLIGSVTASRETIFAADALILSLKDAESAERGFLITGGEQYLTPYQEAVERLRQDELRLQTLARANEKQRPQLLQLHRAIDQRLEQLQFAIAAYQKDGFEGARRIVLEDRGRQLMVTVRGIVDDLRTENARLLSDNSVERDRAAGVATSTLIGAGTLNLVLLGILAAAVRRDARARNTWAAERQRLSLAAERAARAEAEEASRTKDEFLAMLSHELRTPLMPVIMAISAMENDGACPPHWRDEIAQARRNLHIETKLIDDLLDLTRVARGKLELQEEVADVNELVQQALATVVNAEPRAAHLRITTRLGASRHHVYADKARLQQVLWNLTKNAIKFTPDGGAIEIATSNNAAGEIEVAVTDTGAGIEADKLPLIFNAFEQGSREVTRKFGGLGLGLAICRAIVQLHGGRIAAHSDGAGAGARFTVCLPVTIPPAATQAEPLPQFQGQDQPALNDGVRSAGSSGATPGRKIRVLLVEDNLVTLKIMSRLFRDFGYDVTPAADVATALQAASQKAFDLVVSDLGLPDGSGLDLMRELRAKFGLRGIALSGYGQAEDVRESREAGFVEHLVKPVDFARLEATVRRVASKLVPKSGQRVA